MLRRKGWKYSIARKGNENTRSGKCDGHLTEELASLKTETSGTGCGGIEELASLKTENNDIVQGSVNLVTELKKLLNCKITSQMIKPIIKRQFAREIR